ncbi:MAG TPA: type II secretion system F family protein [Gemmatimonadaceae bacterium]|jgi:tight adherence protein B|nr:type II secretion system F family protein [Gemmatimonadaceae bacterium]
MELFLLAGVFVATVILVVGGYVYWNRRTLDAANRARNRLDNAAEAARTASLLRDDAVSHLALLNRILAGRSFTDEITEQLRRAALNITAGAFLLSVILSTIVGIALGLLVRGVIGGVVLGLIGGLLPVLWLRRRQRKRRLNFEAQLPEAIDMLVSAMRAGYSFQAAMNFIGQEMSAPIGPEFSRFYEEQRLGIDVRTAMTRLQERVDSLDLRMFVTAVLIQRETGGNLAEVLTNLSDLMRQRVAVRGQIETLTAEPKLSAQILSALPVLVFIVIWFADPNFMRPMITSDIGKLMLLMAAVSVVIGYSIMLSIADIDF